MPVVVLLLYGDEPPSEMLELLPSFEIARPLPRIDGMLISVVLDQELEFGVAQIEAHLPFTVGVPDYVVDVGFGETGKHNEHSQAGFHGRVDALAYESGRPTRGRGARMPPVIGGGNQHVGCHHPSTDQRIAKDDEVDQSRSHAGDLAETLRGG